MSRSRYEKQDRFHQQAKKDNWAARSVYKLEELDRRYGLVRRGQRVVDFGCAPGSWLQYLGRAVGKRGAVVGYDVEAVSVAGGPHVRTFEASVTQLDADRILRDLYELAHGRTDDHVPPSFRAHLVVSDMAPKLTGIRDADQAKSVELVTSALSLAAELLPAGDGKFAAKLFQGRDTDAFLNDVRARFKTVKLVKPEATRAGSREVFVIGVERR